MFFSTGFRLKIKGIRASEKEAPVLALAPHSTFYDAFPVVVLTAPSLVVKADTQNVPFFASMNKKPTFSRLFLAFFRSISFFSLLCLEKSKLPWLLPGSVLYLPIEAFFSFWLCLRKRRNPVAALFSVQHFGF